MGSVCMQIPCKHALLRLVDHCIFDFTLVGLLNKIDLKGKAYRERPHCTKGGRVLLCSCHSLLIKQVARPITPLDALIPCVG
jgi:hypothetical protein